MTVGELRERMSSAEFSAWMAFNAMDPIGEQRADLRNAMAMRQEASIHSGRGRKYEIQDFMPFRIEQPSRDLTPEELAEKWKAAFKGRER